jgi:hypothetical protein
MDGVATAEEAAVISLVVQLLVRLEVQLLQ